MKPLHMRPRSPSFDAPITRINRHPLCFCVPLAALLFLMLLVSSKQSTSTSTTSPLEQIQSGGKAHAYIQRGELSVRLSNKITNDNKVAFDHCSSSASKRSIVMLHGAAFSKKDWTRSNILPQLCGISPTLQITALDLPVTATASELRAVLQALYEQKLVTSLPVTALVTPSASGSAVSEWITNTARSDARDLLNYIETWIPVASNSVQRVPDDALLAIETAKWPILAIYGNQDKGGKKSMLRLGKLAGATVVELRGHHPVYLDSPSEFILAILDYLNIDTQRIRL